jgi:hypothetical protein
MSGVIYMGTEHVANSHKFRHHITTAVDTVVPEILRLVSTKISYQPDVCHAIKWAQVKIDRNFSS